MIFLLKLFSGDSIINHKLFDCQLVPSVSSLSFCEGFFLPCLVSFSPLSKKVLKGTDCHPLLYCLVTWICSLAQYSHSSFFHLNRYVLSGSPLSVFSPHSSSVMSNLCLFSASVFNCFSILDILFHSMPILSFLFWARVLYIGADVRTKGHLLASCLLVL